MVWLPNLPHAHLQIQGSWALGEPTDGFRLLVEKGLPELTAEFLVVKYATRFPEAAVDAARERMA